MSSQNKLQESRTWNCTQVSVKEGIKIQKQSKKAIKRDEPITWATGALAKAERDVVLGAKRQSDT